MMKLFRLVSSRNQLSKSDASSLYASTQSTSFSTVRQNFADKGKTGDQVFAPFCIYKGKAAVSLAPVLPTFTKLQSGNLVVDRRGFVALKFTPAIGERKYDWERRQVFALSATEIGSLISLGNKDSCEFFHDPSMKSSNAGQVRKNLSIKPNADGYFMSLNVVNNLLKTKENFSVPVTTAEFAVMKTACSFALPHIMGWDRVTKMVPGGIEGYKSFTNNKVPRSLGENELDDLLDEWDR